MSETTQTQTAPDPKIGAFANAVLPDYEEAMDRFFDKVQTKALSEGLTDAEVVAALTRGYGYEVSEAWTDWIEADA